MKKRKSKDKKVVVVWRNKTHPILKGIRKKCYEGGWENKKKLKLKILNKTVGQILFNLIFSFNFLNEKWWDKVIREDFFQRVAESFGWPNCSSHTPTHKTIYEKKSIFLLYHPTLLNLFFALRILKINENSKKELF